VCSGPVWRGHSRKLWSLLTAPGSWKVVIHWGIDERGGGHFGVSCRVGGPGGPVHRGE